MVSSGVSVTAAVMAALVVAATADPHLFKGGRRCHPKIIPYYNTIYDKVGHSGVGFVRDGARDITVNEQSVAKKYITWGQVCSVTGNK